MNKYNKVMENVKVTEEMRSRILQNIEEELSRDNASAIQAEPVRNNKVVDFKKVYSVIATLAAVIVGFVVLSNVMLQNNKDTFSATVAEADGVFEASETAPAYKEAAQEAAQEPYEVVEINGVSVKLYGEDGLYYAAEWETSEGSFSVIAEETDGVSLEGMKALVMKNMKKVKNN